MDFVLDVFQVSVELCKILLSLDDKYAIDNFTIYRMSALTELAVINPEPVAGYLTHEHTAFSVYQGFWPQAASLILCVWFGGEFHQQSVVS